MGASERRLEAIRGSIERDLGIPAGDVPVWPQHWHAVKVFLAMGSQWRTRGAGEDLVYEGLRYEGLPIVLQEHRRLPSRWRQPLARLMPQLRALERAACKELNAAQE